MKKFWMLLEQWKRYFDVQKLDFLPKPSRSHGLKVPVVVSLTTLPHLSGCLQATLNSLLDQSILPDRIEINIPRHSKDRETTYDLSPFYWDNPLISVFPIDDDLGPITKLIPTLKRYRHHPDALIICVDDDMCYPYTMIEEFIAAHASCPNAVLTRTGSGVPENGRDKDRLKLKVKGHHLKEKKLTDMIHGYAGFCVQPCFFGEDFLESKTFLPETYYADDVWISGYLARKKIPRYVIPVLSPRLQIYLKGARKKQRLSRSTNKNGQNNEILMRYFAHDW